MGMVYGSMSEGYGCRLPKMLDLVYFKPAYFMPFSYRSRYLLHAYLCDYHIPAYTPTA
ncbi:uncharacterized protein CELE_F19B6.10 [Caenorhabditis elegans]|uniref:Uncharacterized protein n=1 Tax=Caenorhabditis elegans TaxID=6239 RepID=U4PM70_CAEEL|nr:Uncharacterized protein CELE_F19B6.10 [Caenorhabditis elegans]CDH93169.1 Uncharacterized protein CELE_F19B6.10 [Caenorhabditis elegans]|eukprot:NP_001294417.1 Uncharacterized protein CELE_F19B6.10 [Caenorhabditis elegans]